MSTIRTKVGTAIDTIRTQRRTRAPPESSVARTSAHGIENETQAQVSISISITTTTTKTSLIMMLIAVISAAEQVQATRTGSRASR